MDKEEIISLIERYPIFEWVNEDLYFKDKRMHISALTIEKLHFMNPGEILIMPKINTGSNTFSLTIDQNDERSVLFVPIIKVLPDDLCVHLYEGIPNLSIHTGSGIGYEEKYDRVDIIRKHTLKNLLDE